MPQVIGPISKEDWVFMIRLRKHTQEFREADPVGWAEVIQRHNNLLRSLYQSYQ